MTREERGYRVTIHLAASVERIEFATDHAGAVEACYLEPGSDGIFRVPGPWYVTVAMQHVAAVFVHPTPEDYTLPHEVDGGDAPFARVVPAPKQGDVFRAVTQRCHELSTEVLANPEMDEAAALNTIRIISGDALEE